MDMERKILIVGPCVIEPDDIMYSIAEHISRLVSAEKFDLYFKASFDKANRTSMDSYRGPGLDKGLEILYEIKCKYKFRILTDIHEPSQAEKVSKIADVIQIPALLCRQTDLIIAAAQTGNPINIKKGQFLSGKDMYYPVEKARIGGAKQVWVTERGNCFGYNDVVVDFRNIPDMKNFADKIIMDCTHSVQRPGGLVGCSGGDPQYIEAMAMAASAFGADGYFFEVHTNPSVALCDGACMLELGKLDDIISKLC